MPDVFVINSNNIKTKWDVSKAIGSLVSRGVDGDKAIKTVDFTDKLLKETNITEIDTSTIRHVFEEVMDNNFVKAASLVKLNPSKITINTEEHELFAVEADSAEIFELEDADSHLLPRLIDEYFERSEVDYGDTLAKTLIEHGGVNGIKNFFYRKYDEDVIRKALGLDDSNVFSKEDENEGKKVKFGPNAPTLDPSKIIDDEKIWVKNVVSNNPFTIFVSDLHPADSTAGDDFFINHFDQMAGMPHGISKAYFLGAFLQAQQTRFKNRYQEEFKGLELVLLGDCFDLMECRSRGTNFKHEPLGSVLKKFKDDGNSIIHILGNHDPITPKSYIPLMTKIGRTYYNSELKIFGIHGHQFDKANYKSTSGVGPTIGLAAMKLEPQIINFNPFSNLKKRPFIPIDNVRPLHRMSYWYKKWINTSTAASSTGPLAKEIAKYLGTQAIEKILNDSDNYLIEHASKLLIDKNTMGEGQNKISCPPDTRFVVMGHTHFPVHAGKYFNLGTWMAIYGLVDDPKSPKEEWFELWPCLMHYKDPETKNIESEFWAYHFKPNGHLLAKLNPLTTDSLRKRFFGDTTKTLDPESKMVKSI